MTDREQATAFSKELNMLVDRYMEEFDIPLETVVGILEVMKLDLVQYDSIIDFEELEDDDEDEED